MKQSGMRGIHADVLDEYGFNFDIVDRGNIV